MDIFSEEDPIAAIEDSMTRTSSRRYDIISDMDEVLVNITPTWVARAIADDRIRGFLGQERIDWLSTMDLTALVLGRDVARLSDWMGLDEERGAVLHSIYHDSCHAFYDELNPTTFGIGMEKLLSAGIIRKMFVVTHVGPGDNSSKDRFIERVYPGKEVELIKVPLVVPKSKVINERGIRFATFVDDSLKNIMDVMRNTPCDSREFMMPRLGYNTPTEEMLELATSRRITLRTYREVV